MQHIELDHQSADYNTLLNQTILITPQYFAITFEPIKQFPGIYDSSGYNWTVKHTI